jgi:small-conductance mechanosensitive channel
MAEQDKPFVCYKNGWNLQIMPRNWVGWRALMLWLLVLAVPTAPFVYLMARQPSDAQVTAYVIGYVFLTVVWSLAMLRWMYLNSEVIDLKELLKRELEARKRR